jgi:hypothetical protein
MRSILPDHQSPPSSASNRTSRAARAARSGRSSAPGGVHRGLRSRVAVLFAAAIVLALPSTAVGHGRPPGPADAYVAAWDAIGVQAVTAAGLTPPDGHLIFAYVAVAEYDSVIAVQRGYRPFAIHALARPGTSAEAAVAAAAHAVLVHYLPAQATTILDPAYATSLLGIEDGQAKIDGIALGERVAAAWIAMRADDGYRAAATYTPPDPPIPGVWSPTATTPPIGTYLPAMRPFTLRSAAQFRPAGPPSLDSSAWAHDYNETKDIGGSTSLTRTIDQTLAARFWAEPPVPQARASFRKFVLDHHLDVVDAVRFMAMVSVTYADALIACWDAKYHFAFWRPITAIRAGDTDGNDATIGDTGWSPLLPATPNHPEYPSAHSCITPAGGLAIARFLDNSNIDFTVPSVTGLGDRHFATVADLEYEVGNARIWGGIHFRTAVNDGIAIAHETARWVLGHAFQGVNG